MVNESTFLCGGVSMSLYSGIYPTVIGNMKSFNDAASFHGLVGIMVEWVT